MHGALLYYNSLPGSKDSCLLRHVKSRSSESYVGHVFRIHVARYIKITELEVKAGSHVW